MREAKFVSTASISSWRIPGWLLLGSNDSGRIFLMLVQELRRPLRFRAEVRPIAVVNF